MTFTEKRIFVIASVLISFFTYLAVGMLAGKVAPWSTVQSVAAFVCAYLMLSLMMKRFPEEAENEIVTGDVQKDHGTSGKPRLVRTVVLSSVLMLCVNFALSFIVSDTSVPDREDLLLRAVTGVFVLPAMEEYLFRHGYLKALLRGNFPEYVPIILQAVLFAGLHKGVGIPVAFICGIILGVTYVKTDERHSFIAVYASHAIYNGVLYAALALT